MHALLGLIVWGYLHERVLNDDGTGNSRAHSFDADREGVLYLLTSRKHAAPKRSRRPPVTVTEEESEIFTVSVRERPSSGSPAGSPAIRLGAEGGQTIGGVASDDHGSGTGPSGGAVFFGAAARGRRIVYVIDRSLSMGLNRALGKARAELFASLDLLPADVEFQVVLYNRRAEPLRVNGSVALLKAEKANISEVKERAESMRAEGSTDHLRALKEAIYLKPEVIFVVTDADGLTPDMVNSVARMNVGKAVIHCIELANAPSGGGSPAFRRLAEVSAGTYRLVAMNRTTDELGKE
jgi:hypothetical protein